MTRSSVIAQCVCGQKNRLPPSKTVRCGKCKRIFSATEIREALGRPTLVQDEDEEDEEDED